MYAVIEDSGVQFRVEEGATLDVDMRPAQPGETIQFDRVLLISAEGGATVGTPVIPEAKVIAEVVGEVKGEKIHTMRFKRRKRVHVRTGHRQHYIRVRVKQIVVPGAAEAPKAE